MQYNYIKLYASNKNSILTLNITNIKKSNKTYKQCIVNTFKKLMHIYLFLLYYN